MQTDSHPLDHFNHELSTYKAVNGWTMAMLSAIAYRKPFEIEQYLAGRSSHIVHLKDDKTGADGFAADCGKFCAIVFRGTAGFTDIRTDAKAHLVPFETIGSVHSGFLSQLDAVWGEISTFLSRANEFNDPRPVWFTGHSLGGAVTLLAALRSVELFGTSGFESLRLGHVYTFGQPRAGDADFANNGENLLNGRYHRATKGNDLVANVLPPGVVYTHFGREWYVKRSGAINPSVRATTKSWDRRRGLIAFALGLLPNLIFERTVHLFHDHSCEKYAHHFYRSFKNAENR
ncbi:lipase family protein [Thalassomonas sp. RHCl1]|uniref:lipase family protein n=1 Tax=Thalassomonas sp. RHCl1 TaxID=2995320 RepID=UPI00248BFCFC|nr:lipase family protein [Thalassomonas sp. RHCl1]